MAMQLQQHYLARTPESALIIQSVCGSHDKCLYCNHPLSLEQAAVLSGRAFVVAIANGHPLLFLCTHCTYHHVRVIPEKHGLHWNNQGKWSNLGAPLDQDTATKFCRMLSCPSPLAVVVL